MLKSIQILNSDGVCLFRQEFEEDFCWTVLPAVSTPVSVPATPSPSTPGRIGPDTGPVAAVVARMVSLSRGITGKSLRWVTVGSWQYWFAVARGVVFVVKFVDPSRDVLRFPEKFALLDTISRTFVQCYAHVRADLVSTFEDYAIFGEYTMKVVAQYHLEAIKTRVLHLEPPLVASA